MTTKRQMNCSLTAHDVVQLYVLKFRNALLEFEAGPMTHEDGLWREEEEKKQEREEGGEEEVLPDGVTGQSQVRTSSYPHAPQHVVKAVVAKETTPVPCFLWNFPAHTHTHTRTGSR